MTACRADDLISMKTCAKQLELQPTASSPEPTKGSQRGTSNVVKESTSAPACPCLANQTTTSTEREPAQQEQSPTCSSENEEMSIWGVPHQQKQQSHHHHHHHHHHHYHREWATLCCSPSSALSSSSPSLQQGNAEHSSPSSHTRQYPLRTISTTTHIGPPSCTNYPLHFLPSSPICCLAHTDTAHTLAPAIFPFQPSSTHSPIKDIDLYSAPYLPLKRPKKLSTQKPKGLKLRFPPFPSPATSPPYVICQHCFQLLALPLHNTTLADGTKDQHHSVVKLRCALCLRVSFFSTRRTHLPLLSSSKAARLGSISALDSAKDCVNAGSEVKEELKLSMGHDEPTTISSEGRVSKLKGDQQKVVKPDLLPLSHGKKTQQEAEKGNKYEHLDTSDASMTAHLSSPPYMTAVNTPTGELSPVQDDIEITEAHMPIIIETFGNPCANCSDRSHHDSLKNACVGVSDLRSHVRATNALIGECCQAADDFEIMELEKPIIDSLRYACFNGTTLRHHEESLHSPPTLNPEFSGFSSVQDWVNSLEQEILSPCATPLMGTGFGSDILRRDPLHWQTDDQHGNEMAVLPVPGSPLHEHFGYKSARELLSKTVSSDDEVKAHSDSNSSPSTSNASANTFKPPGFDNGGETTLHTSVTQAANGHAKISRHAEQDDQSSLANLLKRSFKGFGERKSIAMSSGKLRVVVNGHALSEVALKRAEEKAGKLRAGTYWYDSMAGFWGIVGGPCLGVLPPFIEELHYSMAGNCSNGDTQVFVNGRELHRRDLELLSHRGLSKKPGRTYAISFDGVVIDEASGAEVKHLGKLAPTVEKRGKGFGMYMEKSRR